MLIHVALLCVIRIMKEMFKTTMKCYQLIESYKIYGVEMSSIHYLVYNYGGKKSKLDRVVYRAMSIVLALECDRSEYWTGLDMRLDGLD